MLVIAVALLAGGMSAQEAPKPSSMDPHARIMAATSIYIEHAGGTIPNDVIGDAFQGWGRYTVVSYPERANLVVSINAPVSDSGVSVGGGGRGSGKALSSGTVMQIRLTILDAHDRVVLWSGIEQPKGSMKQHQREDNEVEASLKLFRRFRGTVEPEPAQ
jgi:hypothetical protein